VIDGAINGSARTVGGLAGVMRGWQTGRLTTYALVMLLGIFGLMTWKLWPTVVGPYVMNLFR
jgi:NADH-quinone oxidoreductase subunit L